MNSQMKKQSPTPTKTGTYYLSNPNQYLVHADHFQENLKEPTLAVVKCIFSLISKSLCI